MRYLVFLVISVSSSFDAAKIRNHAVKTKTNPFFSSVSQIIVTFAAQK
jgi:hypothetical protein